MTGTPAARVASRAADLLRSWWRARRFYSDPIVIRPFRGHGTGSALYLKGRVLEEPGVGRARRGDPAWRNLLATFRRFESDEIGGARLVARFAGLERELVTERDGYFDLSLELSEPLSPGTVWHGVELKLLHPPGGRGNRPTVEPVRAIGHVLVPRDPGFAVVSDLDDTVIRTSVTDLLAMARLVLLGNAHTRLPFEGVAAFYRALRGGPDGRSYNPIFYVSSGPWNLYDLIEEFLDLNGIPVGPIFLRDWGFGSVAGQAHKIGVIRRLMAAYPGTRFVLIGDSGERDPEIYRQLALEHPGRVIAIYVRAVSDARRNARVAGIAAELAAGNVPMLLVADTVSAASHARGLGLLAPEAVPEVRAERREEVTQPRPSALSGDATKAS